ncbi:MAG: dipeptide/oligopeptide/nickel ABC transporter ATP-binding protein, partial [Chloroflexota bacterium]
MRASPVQTATSAILRVEDLHVQFRTPRGVVRAVDGVSFALRPGERFGLVGESGSGKSTIALALMRLIKPPGQITGGRMLLGDEDLSTLPEPAMRMVRMARIALIPQGAMNSLNPVMRIKQQMLDGILAHRAAWGTGNGAKDESRQTRREWEERIGDLLESVGLRREVAGRYPPELSGG